MSASEASRKGVDRDCEDDRRLKVVAEESCRAEGSADWLEAITARLRDFRDERDWEQFHSPRNLAVSVAVESGELLEHFQWRTDDEIGEYLVSRGDEVADELADVMVYLVQLADVVGVSLAESVERKIDLNEKRYPATRVRGRAVKYTELG